MSGDFPAAWGVPCTIQASEALMRQEMPHACWQPDFAYVVEGRQIGFALRETGDDLIFVKFPLITDTRARCFNDDTDSIIASTHTGDTYGSVDVLLPPSSLTLIAISVHRRWVVPVRLPTGYLSSNVSSSLATPMDEGHAPDGQNPCGVELFMRADGKPTLCVVCGCWDPHGDYRKSGFKCSRCVGVRSNERLRIICERLERLGADLMPRRLPAGSETNTALTATMLQLLSASDRIASRARREATARSQDTVSSDDTTPVHYQQ